VHHYAVVRHGQGFRIDVKDMVSAILRWLTHDRRAALACVSEVIVSVDVVTIAATN